MSLCLHNALHSPVGDAVCQHQAWGFSTLGRTALHGACWHPLVWWLWVPLFWGRMSMLLYAGTRMTLEVGQWERGGVGIPCGTPGMRGWGWSPITGCSNSRRMMGSLGEAAPFAGVCMDAIGAHRVLPIPSQIGSRTTPVGPVTDGSLRVQGWR